ncbi:hypothetical protein HPB52_018512 [Rhipicephalus sanguineus]|uniref:Endonuclease/exonuclease/phosphatase domain-containing protein n=1 Tax=Rhipicephalus sanguineus TaxID=34632 RepID=A0A9D4QDT2_RHISA|nr:hypothetical protein HPB52_018512 [Rhipicephalus sanguineus]
MNGARHVLKWEELYRTMTAEHILLCAVAETHLRELEEPPIHADWRWEGKNRAGHGRKGGGVGFLWRREQEWQREDRGCADHLWMTGDLMGIPVAVCVVYLTVKGVHYEENERLLECVLGDAERLAGCREVLILGDFNGHISELDGYTDANGKLLTQLAERLQLEILNAASRCEGQTTWCARGSGTSIDYALASDGLVKALRRLHIDEEGMHSIGSDHNRLRLDFSKAQHQKPDSKRRLTPNRYLPVNSLEKVAEQFERSPERENAKTYEEYVSVLCHIMERHKVTSGTRPARYDRKPWWDKEVAEAWHARREANRSHRRAVKMKDAVQTDVTWQRYLQLKRDMQALVQVKLSKSNVLFLQKLKSEGRNAAQKFWNYVRTLDRREQSAQFIVDSTGNPAPDMKEALTTHLKTLYGPLGCTRDLQFDDGNSQAELQALLDICATEMTSLGLRFNAKKTKVVPFAGNMAEAVDLKLGSESIAMETTYKYLGVLLCSEASIYNQQEAHIRQASLRAQCILRRRILWGCNRFIMENSRTPANEQADLLLLLT